ncbi:hypothetical protein ABQF17_06800 [Mycolicibacterium elephantis]|uniref:hypothetical protein n=1 Tax=Mycolicibacterium elephantis TaxID=81858 RepID=UPI000629B6B4|nr:hypothetical protein [Mycolicibacterium elephantis]KKW65814.1 membrane protein [Mycolicibacterium elephantis]OBB16481.1 hypothetical protein A5762_02445 [Mycolicibacterium elephantis]OBE94933.1 hypothetical protein A5776_21555 [Mycolicibacterium elephantis]
MSSAAGAGDTLAIDEKAADETFDATYSNGEAEVAITTRRLRFRVDWGRTLIFGLLPGVVMMSAVGCGYLKWHDASARASAAAATQSVKAAVDGTVAMLSYRPDTAEKDLGSARDRLTGQFRDSYTTLIHDVVIPGAKQKDITAVTTVPGAALVSATPERAVVLVFVNQTTTVGDTPPTDSASSVRVTLDRVGNGWLISDFNPV